MVDVFVHRTGLDTVAVEESRDLVQVVSDGKELPCDCFDLVRVDIEHIRGIHTAFHQHLRRKLRGSSRHLLPAGVKVHVLFL